MTTFHRPKNPDGTMPPFKDRGFYLSASRLSTWLGVLIALGTIFGAFMAWGVPIVEAPATVAAQGNLIAANTKEIGSIKELLIARDQKAEKNHFEEMNGIQTILGVLGARANATGTPTSANSGNALTANARAIPQNP